MDISISKDLAVKVGKALCDGVCPTQRRVGQPWPHEAICKEYHEAVGIRPECDDAPMTAKELKSLPPKERDSVLERAADSVADDYPVV